MCSRIFLSEVIWFVQNANLGHELIFRGIRFTMVMMASVAQKAHLLGLVLRQIHSCTCEASNHHCQSLCVLRIDIISPLQQESNRREDDSPAYMKLEVQNSMQYCIYCKKGPNSANLELSKGGEEYHGCGNVCTDVCKCLQCVHLRNQMAHINTHL